MTSVECPFRAFFALVNIRRLCVVSLGRFFRAKFLFLVEFMVLFLRRN